MKTAEETERIVMEVIRRLTAAKSTTITQGGTLVIDDRVITLATLENRLQGITQVVVQPQAVLTPSVQDELRMQNIQLLRQAQPIANHSSPRLFVANPPHTLSLDLINDLPCEATALDQASWEVTLVNMTRLLNENALGVLFTDRPEAAVCQANRHHHVHAFVGHSSSVIGRAATTMPANLLVLESCSNSAAAEDMIRSFVSAVGGSK